MLHGYLNFYTMQLETVHTFNNKRVWLLNWLKPGLILRNVTMTHGSVSVEKGKLEIN